MHTGRIQRITSLILVALWLGGCGLRPCQLPLAETPKSITQYPWKLTRSSDRSIQVTSSNFVIYQFASNFTGTMKTVLYNNDSQQGSGGGSSGTTPFKYLIPNRGQNLLCISFDQSVAQVDMPALCNSGSSKVLLYKYSLAKTGLTLDGLSKDAGGNLTFVDYRGAIAPDDNCQL